MARDCRRQEESDLQERVVYIHRVSKTVKGGRRMSLLALVVVGDGKGNVGVGMGKSAEVPLAIQKGVDDAKKNMFHVPVTDERTIPHEVEGHYGAGRVLIAGGPVRPLFELAGIHNVLSKSLGTNNALNIIKAAAEGLKQLSSPAETAERRGITVGEMFVGKEN